MMQPDSLVPGEDRLLALRQQGRNLSESDVKLLEEQLRKNPSAFDVRVQLFAYFSEYEGNGLKHENAEKKLSEQALWLIENHPSISGSLGHDLASSGLSFGPKAFAALRQAWLEQVALAPLNGTVIGNAASFIAWNDFETASALFERAYTLQPNSGWFGIFVIHCNSHLRTTPFLYKNEVCRRIVDVGLRSLETEPDGAPFLTCEYVSDAALILERFDVVRKCAEILRNWGHPSCDQMATAYLGLVALREADRDSAVKLMLEIKRGYVPQPVVFRLAKELFDAGERESIIQLISSFETKIKEPARTLWPGQIANDLRPDFDDYWCSSNRAEP